MSDTQQAAGQDTTATPAQGDSQTTEQQQQTLLYGGDQPPQGQGEGQPQGQPGADTQQQGEPKGEGQDEPNEGDKPKDADQDKPDGVPEKYDLKPPEGFESLDKELVSHFEPLARELKLSNEGAQKLVETMMPKVVQRITEQQQQAWMGQLEAWVEDVKKDPEIGGEKMQTTLQDAKRALDRFATPELKALIEYPSADNPRGLGLGNHPELVRLFARIGKAMAEDRIVTGNGNGADARRDPAEILYGNS